MNFVARAGSRTVFDSLDITESTKQDYLSRVPVFLGFVQRNGITRDLLLDYKKYLRTRNDLGVASKNKYLAVARLTLRELHRQGVISADLSTGVKSFQMSTKHKVQGLNDDEVQTVCNYLRSIDNSFKAVRLRTLVALLLFQGLRQIEVCRLDITDVDLISGIIRVQGKGRDDKEDIYLHQQTIKALTAYIKMSHVKHGPLFYPLRTRETIKRLSTRGLRSIIQTLFNQLGITRTVHGTRHYFTTQLIKHYGSDLTQVSKYTRHQNIEMLNVYNDSIKARSDLIRYNSAFIHKVLN